MVSRKIIFLLLCLANIAISFNFSALAAVIPQISRDLAISNFFASQILPFYMIPYGLGALIYAPLTRKVNFKTILISSLVVYGLTNLICSTGNNVYVFLVSRTLMGISAGAIVPLTLILIGKLFPKETRGRFVGMFFSSSFIASVSGIAISGVMPWRALFLIPGFLGLANAAVFGIYSVEQLHETTAVEVNYLRVFKSRQLRDILFFIFAMSFLYHGVHKWLGVYLNKIYALPQFEVSLYFMLIALCGAVGQNIGGYLTDHRGRRFATTLGVAVLGISTMFLFRKYPLWVLGLILGMFSVGWSIGHNGISTVLTDYPDEDRAEIAGLNSSVRFVSGGLGFFLGGPFVERNFGLTFFVFGILMLLSGYFIQKIIPQDFVQVEGGRHV